MKREELLTLPVATDVETAGRAFGIGRALAYDLAKRGEFPVRVLRVGRLYRVVTADVLEALGIYPKQATAQPAKTTSP